MAPPKKNLSQYNYEEISSKVLQADRRYLDVRASDNATGEPESLSGRISLKDMGSRVQREKPPVEEGNKKVAAAATPSSDQQPRQKRKRTNANAAARTGAISVLDSTDAIEGIRYFPQTPESRETFQLILSWTQSYLPDVPNDAIRSAADAILETLKSEDLKDYDKKKEIESILGDSTTPEKFNQIVNLAKKITDYSTNESATTDTAATDIDQQLGVNVLFDEDRDEDQDMQDEDEDDEEYDDANSIDVDDEYADVGDQDHATDTIETIGASMSQTTSDDIPAHEIDAFWLQRRLSTIFHDAHTIQEKSKQVLDVLASSASLRQAENDLMEIFNFEYFEQVTFLCKNREKIVWCIRLDRAENEEERKKIESEMEQAGFGDLLNEIRGNKANAAMTTGPSKTDSVPLDRSLPETENKLAIKRKPRLVDLDSLVFDQGSHLLSNAKVRLPEGSFKRPKKRYEEIHVPAPKPAPTDNESLVEISSLPEWVQPAFPDSKSLNRIQSKMFPVAFNDDENILLCAPTGAGKTNVALLTIMRTISQYRDDKTGNIDLSAFKMVYIAPLKALVQEQVGEFSRKLASYGIKVTEVTGDTQLTKSQISESQLLVTTPEKWDVITRKATEGSYTNLVRLIIIDEIHLLHDERGPVIESIVARTLRRSELTSEPVRLIGLSATLPNYHDVASFLRVDEKKGLFYFDATFRPCPLAQQFIGVTEKRAFRRYQAMNDAAYDKVIENATNHQVIIFVHSRKETTKLAKYIRDKALEEETIGSIMKTDAASREILSTEAESIRNPDLRDLLPYGFAVHHAGLNRSDRTSSEELFADGHVRILVSTATLAWGVNLPAHTVIIKGTQIYSPERGKWVELSPQDVLQMLGRAGRPRYDVSGEGIIITAQSELQYYLSLMNQQLPIESQFMSRLADNMNAEISLGTIRSIDDAIEWLGYTYLYVRMLRSPSLYHVGAEYADDKTLIYKRQDLCHSAAVILEKGGLVKYNPETGRLLTTDLGRIASHYYISHSSMATYSSHLKANLSSIELFRIFSLSEEFQYIPVRQEEKLELAKLLERVPIPIKENIEEPPAKINLLLQAYIAQLKLDGFALMADMVYVTQSAGRLWRAIFEIALRRGWSKVAKTCLSICKMVEKRMWLTSSPLRQFPTCPANVIKKTESSRMSWDRYFDLQDPGEVGQAIKDEKNGRLVYQLLQEFPKLEIQVHVQPITRTLLRMELNITSKFQWNSSLHGNAEGFWIIVEDCDGEKILYFDTFVVHRRHVNDEHIIEFSVPISEPVPPNYFVSLISDRWLHCEAKVPVLFTHLILPDKFPAHTPLLELQPTPVSALKDPQLIDLYPDWDIFNKVQTQVFKTVFNTDDDMFVGAAVGSGKTVIAELSLLRHWQRENAGRAVYISPFQEQIDQLFSNWSKRLGSSLGKQLSKLTGDMSADLRILERSHLILATPSQWDLLSRRWQVRRNVQTVELFIADDLHLLGGSNGSIYESVTSRMRFMSAEKERPIRMVGLSVPIANSREIGEWIGASTNSFYNFAPLDRLSPLEIHLQSFNINHHPSLLLAMARPAFNAAKSLAGNGKTIIFADSRRQCFDTSFELIKYADYEGNEDQFRSIDLDDLESVIKNMQDQELRENLIHGIGVLYESMAKNDQRAVERLFNAGAIRLLLVTHSFIYSLTCRAPTVVILGTQLYEGREHRYVDYQVSDILEILGHAYSDEGQACRAMIFLPVSKREYYKKFLNEALPVESHLNLYLHDALIPEISTGVVKSSQDAIDWLTFSYFYRRLFANPSFYGLVDTSNEGLSEYLSNLVETTLKDLVDANLIEVDWEEETVEPLNGARIATQYDVSFITMQTLLLSLTAKTKLKGLLEVASLASEFEVVPIRHHEDIVLDKIYSRVPLKTKEFGTDSPHFKIFLLLQAHFSRISLPPELASDQKLVISRILRILLAAVDVLSSEGHLNATSAMDLSQMVVQAVWDKDSDLKQIPFFTNQLVTKCNEASVESVADLMMLEDKPRRELLQVDDGKLSEMAKFMNKYPFIDMSFELQDAESIVAGEPAFINVTLEREIGQDEQVDLQVSAPFYPGYKMENWWLVIGEPSTRQLLAIKRVTIAKSRQIVKLEYSVPTHGEHQLVLWCVCDSYKDTDIEKEFQANVEEGPEEDDAAAGEEDVEMAD